MQHACQGPERGAGAWRDGRDVLRNVLWGRTVACICAATPLHPGERPVISGHAKPRTGEPGCQCRVMESGGQREKRPVRRKFQLTGRFRRWWQVLCLGRCWVRTNVG
jgi:hypothetical protein